MRARKAKTELRKTQIAHAALHLVERHGLRGLNYNRLAQAVGVVPSGLYRHYPDKDRVIEAVLNLIQDRMEKNIALARARHENALHRLRILLKAHLELVLQKSFIPQVVFSEEVLQGDNSHSRQMYQIIDGYLAGIEAIIRDGQREGSVRSNVDPKAARQLFLGLIQPSILLWTMSQGRFDIVAQTELCWNLFVHSIASQGSLQQQNNWTLSIADGVTGKDEEI